jgi:hypothetical protein
MQPPDVGKKSGCIRHSRVRRDLPKTEYYAVRHKWEEDTHNKHCTSSTMSYNSNYDNNRSPNFRGGGYSSRYGGGGGNSPGMTTGTTTTTMDDEIDGANPNTFLKVTKVTNLRSIRPPSVAYEMIVTFLHEQTTRSRNVDATMNDVVNHHHISANRRRKLDKLYQISNGMMVRNDAAVFDGPSVPSRIPSSSPVENDDNDETTTHRPIEAGANHRIKAEQEKEDGSSSNNESSSNKEAEAAAAKRKKEEKSAKKETKRIKKEAKQLKKEAKRVKKAAKKQIKHET